uniref:Receptor ligand binding region domain-containing protein n=1 Tax=Vespula pensylvanica TaxID=30213 RepID=A0A834P220_VESPE|nr:hypothetical protein H0235_007904 [Vespula pensylvanica]
MEVVETQSFATEVTAALEKLKEKDVRIILGNFNEVWARRIFCEAYKFGMYGRKYQWVVMGTYAEEWWTLPGGGCAPSELAEALHGAILTDLLPLTTEEDYTVSGIVKMREGMNAKESCMYGIDKECLSETIDVERKKNVTYKVCKTVTEHRSMTADYMKTRMNRDSDMSDNESKCLRISIIHKSKT